ncbi:hypothetical protein CC86DRAFT_383499 [Ophiobolus disseminans]|uniref:Uncharacterized protein n=1 Tax=Ophiobolus disseminans TaxID=1469910 RepID=A0A6A6ZWJ8_9PLEO|nr:hypothetical protein CC86DRAFT_383499 [Ophiobolus disseminans]
MSPPNGDVICKSAPGEIFISNTVSLVINSYTTARAFNSFLSSLPASRPFGLLRVRRLPHIYQLESDVRYKLKTTGKYPPSRNRYMELVSSCPNLRTLDMTFKAAVITTPVSRSNSRRVPRDLTNFIDGFGLRGLLGCEKLEEIMLDGILPFERGSACFEDDDYCMATLGDLGLGLKRRFAKKGQMTGGEVNVWVGYHCEYSVCGSRVKDYEQLL